MRRSAFTLMEILVVITIIMILMGMVFSGISLAKRVAKRAKTDSLMMQVRTALENYKQVNGFYPERGTVWSDIFGTAAPYVKYTDLASKWDDANNRLGTDLELIGESFPLRAGATARILDSWNHSLHYRPAKFYPYKPASDTPALIDSETPPSPDSYQLWSMGPGGIDEGGEHIGNDDDIVSWTRP